MKKIRHVRRPFRKYPLTANCTGRAEFENTVFGRHNGDGTIDSILVADSVYRHFSFVEVDGDGAFDSYEFTTGMDVNSESFRDDGMDGQYDLRIGPGGAMAVSVGSRWHEVVHEDRQSYVELDGKLVPVQLFPVVRIIENEKDESAKGGE